MSELDAIREAKVRLRAELLSAEAESAPPAWGKAAERVRRLPEYRKSQRLFASLDQAVWQMRLNALTDRKQLLLPSPGLQSGFSLLNPKALTPRVRRVAIQPDPKRPMGIKPPYEKPLSPPIDCVLTGALAAGRDGTLLGDGHGHLDLALAILAALRWLHPDLTVIAVVAHLQDSLPAASTDVRADLLVTPQETIATGSPKPHSFGIDWTQLSIRQIRRSEPLFFLQRAQGLHLIEIATNSGADQKRS